MDNVNDSVTAAVDPDGLRPAIVKRLKRRAVAHGHITVPAAPDLLEDYVEMCRTVFFGLGVDFTPEEIEHLRNVLRGELERAYSATQRSDIVITYDFPVGKVLNYHVAAKWQTIGQAYDNWVATRKPPLFGSHPDARVWDLAAQATDPRTHWILDIGGGTGRNCLALARRGHPVDAIEMAPKFAEMLRQQAADEGLTLRIIERDAFAAAGDLRYDYRLILLSEVTPDFRTVGDLRAMFGLAEQHLAVGGELVFNVFAPRDGYTPTAAAVQLGQQCYTMIFTRDELRDAATGLDLELVSDESVYDYEKANLPLQAWPPTGWYADWISGLDVFDVGRDQRPIEMRWLVYRKSRPGAGTSAGSNRAD